MRSHSDSITVDDLERLRIQLLNCLRKLVHPILGDQARKVIQDIESKWSRPPRSRPCTDNPSFYPDIGMLKTVGYTVGVNGNLSTTDRCLLIEYLITANLPFVDSREYTAQWGEPCSQRRLMKLRATLNGLIGVHMKIRGHGLACRQWANDLEYLEEYWCSSD